jgi:hypothetical protein
MKTFITNFLKTTLVAIAFLGASSFALAASFDANPSGSTGIASIVKGDCSNCGGQNTSVSINIPNSGDSEFVTVFTDFMSQRNSGETVVDAYGHYETRDRSGLSGSSYTFGTRLSASNAGSVSDSVTVTGLPSSYKIEFVSGHVENEHGGANGCHAAYNYKVSVYTALFSGGHSLGDLAPDGGSWCAQGTIAVKYRITNTTGPVDTYSWQTGGWGTCSNNVQYRSVECKNQNGSVVSDGLCGGGKPATSQSCSSGPTDTYSWHQGSWGACNNGTQTRTVYCKNQNGTQVSDGLCGGGKPATSQSCSTGGGNPRYDWHQNGYWQSCGNGQQAWIIQSYQCVDRNNGNQVVADSNCSHIQKEQSGSCQTTNHGWTTPRVACESGQVIAYVGVYGNQGRTVQFKVVNGDNQYRNANIGSNESRLVIPRSSQCEQIHYIIPGLVDNSQVGCVTSIPTCGINGESYSWSTGSWGQCINGTKTRTVQCVNQNGNVVADSNCSGTKPNTSESCSIGTQLTVETNNPTNITQTSAVLNGVIASGQSDSVYFVWGTTGSNLSCTSSGSTKLYINGGDTNRNAGDAFSGTLSSLATNTEYQYRACAIDFNGNISSGSIKSFITGTTNGTSPIPTTLEERNVTGDSAELRGSVDMNNVNDGLVFFVWGTDKSEISDVIKENRYRDVNVNGSDIQKEIVDDNFDGSSRFDLDVDGLDADEEYFYRICVEYETESGSQDVKCGALENFYTDEDGSSREDIETLAPRSVNRSSARLCGNYDGGERTWIEFRPSAQTNYLQTTKIDRGSGEYCVDVNGLTPNTNYSYRACSDNGCADIRTFRTLGDAPVEPGLPPVITTDDPTNIRSNAAVLNGTYIANNEAGTCYFNYGRSAALGSKTRTYSTGSGYGTCTHNFTGLASGTQYCVQAVIENSKGRDLGAIKCFVTPQSTVINTTPRTTTRTTTNTTVVTPTPVPVTIVQQDETEIDLSKLGLGLSLVRLSIDNNQDVVTRGENVEYIVEWQNISTLNLENLDLKIVLPKEVQITDVSRGRVDLDENTIYYNLDELAEGEDGSLTISGVILKGSSDNLLNAEATLAYNNPVNQAQENATDFDVDEYGIEVAGVTASVFGLSNITFLGWLVILLGLFILFLVARWMYLEREEMRAHAYINGYRPRPYLEMPQYGMYQDPRGQAYMPHQYTAMPPRYEETQPVPPQAPEYYQPYRPNRG